MLLCVGCGRIDKLAEPLARPPVLAWEPLPPPGSDAEMAAEEHAFQQTEERVAGLPPAPDLEPTGALPGRRQDIPEKALPPARPSPEKAMRRPHKVPYPAPKPDVTEPALPPPQAPPPEAAQQTPPSAPVPLRITPEPPPSPEVTLQLSPAPPAPQPPGAAPETPVVTLLIPPAPPRTSAPQSRAQLCPPPDRDGVVRCPILAGWSSALDYDRSSRGREGPGIALILLGILIAVGVFDGLRRLLR